MCPDHVEIIHHLEFLPMPASSRRLWIVGQQQQQQQQLRRPMTFSAASISAAWTEVNFWVADRAAVPATGWAGTNDARRHWTAGQVDPQLSFSCRPHMQ